MVTQMFFLLRENIMEIWKKISVSINFFNFARLFLMKVIHNSFRN